MTVTVDSAPTAAHLGAVTWYTITSGTDAPLSITRDDVARWFTELGIDPSYLPPTIKGVDAFRSATTTAGDTYVDQGVCYTLIVRETRSGADTYVLRQVFQCWSDDDGPRERRVADLQFFRPHRIGAGRIHGTERLMTMTHQGLTGVHKERVAAVVARCVASYKVATRQLSAHAMRGVVRAYFAGLGAIAVQAGVGTYFVLPDRLAGLAAIQEVVARCGPRCRLVVLPVVDDEQRRALVFASVEAEVDRRCQETLGEIGQWVGHGPSAAKVASWRADFSAVLGVVLEFCEVVGAPGFERAHASLEELRVAVERASFVRARSA